MYKSYLAAVILMFSFSGHTYAQENTKTSIKIDDAAETKNKVPGDIDEEVTNAKLRAESGSKSKLSMSFKTAYTGGAISQPFGAGRPNLNGLPQSQLNSTFDTGINARYRLDMKNSITLGTKIGAVTPFQGRVDKTQNQINVFDPIVGFARLSKWGPMEGATLVTYAYGTSNEAQRTNATHQFVAEYEASHRFDNGVSLGLAYELDYNFYRTAPGQNIDTASPMYGHDKRWEYQYGIYPLAEYAVNDKVSLRTIFGYFNWKHLYGDNNRGRQLQTYIYQSVGVGYAVTRDIFLYPNVQFLPTHIASNATNFTFQASINLF